MTIVMTRHGLSWPVMNLSWLVSHDMQAMICRPGHRYFSLAGIWNIWRVCEPLYGGAGAVYLVHLRKISMNFHIVATTWQLASVFPTYTVGMVMNETHNNNTLRLKVYLNKALICTKTLFTRFTGIAVLRAGVPADRTGISCLRDIDEDHNPGISVSRVERVKHNSSAYSSY